VKLLVSGLVVTAAIIAFVFVWIYLASQGAVPVIQAPLESVSPLVRIVVLVVLAAVIAWLYMRAYPRKRPL
jgi:uncharacterized BrkB/YihY/UPF0761 family membrane protein